MVVPIPPAKSAMWNMGGVQVERRGASGSGQRPPRWPRWRGGTASRPWGSRWCRRCRRCPPCRRPSAEAGIGAAHRSGTRRAPSRGFALPHVDRDPSSSMSAAASPAPRRRRRTEHAGAGVSEGIVVLQQGPAGVQRNHAAAGPGDGEQRLVIAVTVQAEQATRSLVETEAGGPPRCATRSQMRPGALAAGVAGGDAAGLSLARSIMPGERSCPASLCLFEECAPMSSIGMRGIGHAQKGKTPAAAGSPPPSRPGQGQPGADVIPQRYPPIFCTIRLVV